MVAYAKAAVALALAGEADAVLAAPHTERAVAMAGIPFSGYPDLVAAETGTPAERVFLMLVAPGLLVVNATLHIPLAEVPAAITPARVAAAIHAAEDALRMMGRPHPRVAVCGLNPHAGEGGLFGSEDEAVIRRRSRAAVPRGSTSAAPIRPTRCSPTIATTFTSRCSTTRRMSL